MYVQELENYNLGQYGRGWKKMGIQSRISRIVGTIMENTTPWLAGGVSQHLSDYGRHYICKDGRENCCNW
jgi:hypothetical protein